jgi:chromosome condensin MukBEF MukE localization factor
MKILHILCVAYYKLNGVHHCFIMKFKEVLNRFFHVYAINVIVIACVIFFGILYHVFTPFDN